MHPCAVISATSDLGAQPENCFTFSLGRGVGHVPGEHKHDFRYFQTHSFSENLKILKSTKYKYIFDLKKVDEKSKKKRKSTWTI